MNEATSEREILEGTNQFPTVRPRAIGVAPRAICESGRAYDHPVKGAALDDLLLHLLVGEDVSPDPLR